MKRSLVRIERFVDTLEATLAPRRLTIWRERNESHEQAVSRHLAGHPEDAQNTFVSVGWKPPSAGEALPNEAAMPAQQVDRDVPRSDDGVVALREDGRGVALREDGRGASRYMFVRRRTTP